MKCENNFWAVVCAIKRAQCRRRTKQWAPHPGAICSPCPKQPSADQCESKADQCVPRHTTVFAPTFLPNPPLFVRQLHIPCSLEFPRQDSAQLAASSLQHSYNTQLRLSGPSNRFEGPDISPCHPPFCSVTKRNLDSRSAHRFLRNSRVLMPDNSGALWLSLSPSARQFIHMSLQSKLQSFKIHFTVLFHFCSLIKLTLVIAVKHMGGKYMGDNQIKFWHFLWNFVMSTWPTTNCYEPR